MYLNCLFLQVLRIFRPEIPNLKHLLQCACVHFSGAGRSIFHFFAPESFFYRAATFEPTRFIPKARVVHINQEIMYNDPFCISIFTNS